MIFELSDDQTKLRESAQIFAKGELQALGKEMEATNDPPSKEWLRRFSEMGYLGINVSPELGGLGLGNLDALLVVEQLARVHPGIAWPVFESCVGPIKSIEFFAPLELKKRIVPQVCSGELVVAAAMSEPDAGTALTDLKTTGRLQGDKVIIRGAKRWCSGGGHAGGYLVFCRMTDAPGSRGIGAVYIDNGTPGLTFGAREHLMGWRGICHADIFFDDVEVPASNVVAGAGTFSTLMKAFNLERCGNAMMCVAIASAAFDDVLSYVQERQQFGKALIEFQAVQLKLAEMSMQLEAARLLLYKALSAPPPGLPSLQESSTAKCFANEMVRDVCGKAVQLMGGYGYSKQTPMEQRFRDGWGWGIAGGSIDVQKINIAGALAGRRFVQR